MLRTVLTIVIVGSMVMGAEALAQRDAGAKARREFGKGFWSSRESQSNFGASPRLSTPSYPQRRSSDYRGQERQPTESYRSFSFEPAAEADDGDGVAAAPAADEPAEPEREEPELRTGAGPTPCSSSPTVRTRGLSYELTPAVRPRPPEVRLRPGSRRF